jgi:hypothetical protein
MNRDRAQGIERSLTNRSRITNGTRLLEGIDGRTPSARRFRDLIESFSCDLGGMERLTEAERALVKQAASVTIRAEQLQAAIVRGEVVDPDELIRLSNTSRRLLASIRRRAAPKPTLSGYLAAKQGAGQ